MMTHNSPKFKPSKQIFSFAGALTTIGIVIFTSLIAINPASAAEEQKGSAAKETETVETCNSGKGKEFCPD